MHKLTAEVDGVRGEGILGQGGVPVEAQLLAGRGRRPDVLAPAGALIPAGQIALLAHGIAHHGVLRVRQRVKAVAEVHFLPVVVADAAVLPHAAGAAPGAVVLHAAVDVVGRVRVHAQVVVLGQRQVGHEAPGLAPVPGDGHAAVVADDDVVAVGGIDPHGVVIRMHGGEGHQHPETPAAIV